MEKRETFVVKKNCFICGGRKNSLSLFSLARAAKAAPLQSLGRNSTRANTNYSVMRSATDEKGSNTKVPWLYKGG